MVSGKWRELLETCTKTLMCKHLRHACLKCSCLKHACLDLLCKRALSVEKWFPKPRKIPYTGCPNAFDYADCANE